MEILLSIIVIAIIWLVWRKPTQVGGFLYHLNVNIESMLYGLSSKHVRVNGVQIHLKATKLDPDKQTILMLHGFTADFVVWLRFARYFTGKYNVIIPDLLGHGESEYNPGWNYSAKSQTDMLIKLLDELEITKVHVIGNSMGGFISALLALDYVERLHSACYVDPAGIKAASESTFESLLADGINPFLIYDRPGFEKLYPLTMHQSPWLPNIARRYIAARYADRREQITHIFKDFFGQGLLDQRLSEIQTPSLVMWGAKDDLIHVDNAHKWQSSIPNAKLKIWDEIGHMPMLEIPKMSAQSYKDFLELIN